MYMYDSPRVVEQISIIQHTLKFLDVFDYFKDFRLVSKLWKFAVDTIRVDELLILDVDASNIRDHCPKSLRVYRKLCLVANTWINDSLRNVILGNVQNLTELEFADYHVYYSVDEDEYENMEEQLQHFFSTLIQNSKKTLKRLCTPPNLECLDVNLPNLEELFLQIGERPLISVDDFINGFSQILPKLNSIKKINIIWFNEDADNTSLYDFLATNYAKHCISLNFFRDKSVLEVLQVPIITNVADIKLLDNMKFSHSVLYIQFWCRRSENEQEWNRWKETLDQYTNLRAIELVYSGNDRDSRYRCCSILDVLYDVSDDFQKTWEERISYFKSRGIEIVKSGEIYKNTNLEIRCARERDVSWRLTL